jgi:hypothetical protein
MTALSGWPFFEDFRDYLKFIVINIVPRFILAIILSLLFASIDNYASFYEVIALLVLFCFLIYHFLPPTVDTVYVVKKTGNHEVDDVVMLKLMRASKDTCSGIFTLGGSFVIKSYWGRAVKYPTRLKEKHDFAEHEVSREVKSIRGFNEEYDQLLDGVAWKLIVGQYSADVARYHLANLDAIEL